MPSTKIVTCCYCGTKAALVLKGKTRHELACSACGAPLHDLKMLPKSDVGDRREPVTPNRVRNRPPDPIKGYKWDSHRPETRRKKKRKRKSLTKRIFEEAFDVLEDIFD